MNANAAGIDVGATEMFVAVPQDRDKENVRSFPTFTQDLYRLADWLQQCKIKTVAMESTGVYWIPLFQILEDRGFEVCLVNARHMKNVPGRKTDVSDCQWLQYLHSVGLLRASFRPEQDVCAIRSLLRHRESLVQIASMHINHMQKAMDQMNLRLHHVISDITGKSGLAIIDAILKGERDPIVLANLRHGTIRASTEVIAKSLKGDYRSEHLFALRQSLVAYRCYEKLIDDCDKEIRLLLELFTPPNDPPPSEIQSQSNEDKPSTDSNASGFLSHHLKRAFGVDLTKIPSIKALTVQTLFGEIGPDFAKFRSASAFASWLTVCPNNAVSGGKLLSSKTRRSNSRAAKALRMCAVTLGNSKSALGEFYRRMRARLGAPKAITATAHKLARIIYHLVTTGQEFDESQFAADQIRFQQRQEVKLKAKARALGFHLVPILETA